MFNFMDNDELGIGSLKDFNMVLLVKWRFHFYNEYEVLWVKVIHNIHCVHGGLGAISS